ncbi:hypothetical protein SL103_20390 [Streptomyces lydicus]|uniref:Uncharacterized protein n=1 Tax=Streptomyces lydicus TaxID=47763 RepID=A0A1D7VND9_9ACTN|nr:hypothetical protein SL103_20390 [Streptomyces lydicus]
MDRSQVHRGMGRCGGALRAAVRVGFLNWPHGPSGRARLSRFIIFARFDFRLTTDGPDPAHAAAGRFASS